MPTYEHNINRDQCPYLPFVNHVIRPSDLKELKKSHDRVAYYLATQKCAQSLWLCNLPAQAILQLNFSLSENFPDEASLLQDNPLPYRAILWMISEGEKKSSFIGNPVRHFQHLASRMSGKNAELRTWRAWACFHLARTILSKDEYPEDRSQITKENLVIPEFNQVLNSLSILGKNEECKLLKNLYYSGS